LFHDGYTSVFTVNATDHRVQETYLSALGQPWRTQELPAPAVAAGATPTAVLHGGYVSVYTVNAADHTLQETYLPAIGQAWQTQSLSAKYGTPPVAAGTSPAPVVHTSAAGVLDFTSVFTVNATGHTLQETYLGAAGQPWHTQAMPAPAVARGTSAQALYHTGYTSVYTISAGSHALEETYLAANGQPWRTQSLSAAYGTPRVATRAPVMAVVHPDSSGVIDFTSVFTVNASGHTLQETYLPAIGDRWTTQTLPAPPVASETPLP
jgi:hypothetical protein